MQGGSSSTGTASLSAAAPAGGTTVSLSSGDTVGSVPASVKGGGSSTGTLTLSAPAPSGGATVTLSSGNTAAERPGSVTVPAGATSATFTITTPSRELQHNSDHLRHLRRDHQSGTLTVTNRH